MIDDEAIKLKLASLEDLKQTMHEFARGPVRENYIKLKVKLDRHAVLMGWIELDDRP